MKKQILLILSMLVVFSAYSQTEKGNFLLGGNVTASASNRNENSSFSSSISPNIGLFVVKGLALGIQPFAGYDISEYNSFTYYKGKSHRIGISPFMRYYGMLSNKIALFGHLNAGISKNINKTETKDSNTSVTSTSKYHITSPSIAFGPGFTFFLSKNIGIERLLAYNAYKANYRSIAGNNSSTSANSYSYINFNIGLQIFFGKE